jgi:TonB family protein
MNENNTSIHPQFSFSDQNPKKKGFWHYVNIVFSSLTPKELTKGVKISTTIHLSLLIFAVVGPLVIPHRYKNFAPTVHSVQLINTPGSMQQQTSPVIKPEIPTPSKKEVQKPKTEPKKIEQKKPIEKPNQQKPKMTIPEKKKIKPEPKEKTPTLQERLAERLKETEKKKADTKKDWKEADNMETENPLQKNNNTFSGALGASGTLGIASASDFPFQWYLELIHGKISSCWADPQMALDKQSSAIISFTITKTGEIENIFVKKGSGTQSFDQSGIRAIELAKPYPQLPIGYRENELTVNVEFNLENEHFGQ